MDYERLTLKDFRGWVTAHNELEREIEQKKR